MRTRIPLLALLAVAVALAVAACDSSDEGASADTGSAPPSAGAAIPGGGLTIEQAIASTLEGPLMVRGYLVAPEGGPVRLCSALLESYPPQCGEPSLVVEGLDLATVESLAQTSEPDLAQVTWSDAEISILGDVEDGVIAVSRASI